MPDGQEPRLRTCPLSRGGSSLCPRQSVCQPTVAEPGRRMIAAERLMQISSVPSSARGRFMKRGLSSSAHASVASSNQA